MSTNAHAEATPSDPDLAAFGVGAFFSIVREARSQGIDRHVTQPSGTDVMDLRDNEAEVGEIVARAAA